MLLLDAAAFDERYITLMPLIRLPLRCCFRAAHTLHIRLPDSVCCRHAAALLMPPLCYFRQRGAAAAPLRYAAATIRRRHAYAAFVHMSPCFSC